MSKIKDGYKQTEIGIIPIEWEVKKFEELGECIIGLTYKPENVSEDGLLVLRSSNIGEYGLKYYDNVFVNIEVPEKLILKEGDILICVRNGSRELIGKCALIDKKMVGQTFGAFMSIFRTKSSKFIYYSFKSETVKKQINENIGATINQITNKNLNSFKIPLPPLPEQQAIAEVLSDTDSLISNLEKLIDKKKNIKQGTMQELLTGKKRLNGFKGEWEIKKLGEFIKFQVGYPFGSEFFNNKNNGCRLVKNRDLKSNDQIIYYNGVFTQEFVVNNGDILVGMDGEFIPCKWNKGFALLNQRVGRLIKLKSICLIFLYYYLKKPLKEIEDRTSSTTVKHLSHNNIENIIIPLPSLPEQEAIAEVLSDMDSEIEALERKLDKYKSIKQGMMQELLTGRIRLV